MVLPPTCFAEALESRTIGIEGEKSTGLSHVSKDAFTVSTMGGWQTVLEGLTAFALLPIELSIMWAGDVGAPRF